VDFAAILTARSGRFRPLANHREISIHDCTPVCSKILRGQPEILRRAIGTENRATGFG
jgi:hypothetical protein